MRVFLSMLAIAANLAVVGFIVLHLGAKRSEAMARQRDSVLDSISGYELWLGFAVALISTLGSLYLSEIEHLIPCRLCWFQRIFMYPLVVVLGVAAWRRDTNARLTASVLAALGGLISIYHYLIQNFPSLDSGACDPLAPCSAAYIWQWNFVSIPYMAGSGFALILTLMFALRLNVGRMYVLEHAE